MKAIVVGCGRIGSAVAKKLTKAGWDVTAIDENEEALARLGEHWSGGFVVGHGMDVNVLREAGIEEADAVVVATNGDNTNIVVGQVAQKRQPHQTNEILGEPRFHDHEWARRERITSFAGYPLLISGRLVGREALGKFWPWSRSRLLGLPALGSDKGESADAKGRCG